MVELALVALSSAGLLVASYFTLVAYRWVAPDAPWIPSFCRLDERTCASVVFTRQARALGLPNSVFGQLYYGVLLVAAMGNTLDTVPWGYGLLAAAVAAVCLSGYLAYALLWVLDVPCRLCFASHLINIAILGLLLYAVLRR